MTKNIFQRVLTCDHQIQYNISVVRNEEKDGFQRSESKVAFVGIYQPTF